MPEATVLDCLLPPATDKDYTSIICDDDVLKLSVKRIAMDITLQGDPDLDFVHLVRNLPSDTENLSYIEKMTRGQSENNLWTEMRKGLITASDIKRICTRLATAKQHPKTDCSKLVHHIIDRNAEFTTEALEWGKQKESTAKHLYSCLQKKLHKNLKIEERGLQISNLKPFIGCSIDGLVTCSCKGHDQRLIEVKCPFTQRNKSPKEAARERNCQQDPVTGEWSLKEDSHFYYQIQTQLFVYGLDYCDLVLYTNYGILAIPVKYNLSFTDSMIARAQEFYNTYVVEPLLYDHKTDSCS